MITGRMLASLRPMCRDISSDFPRTAETSATRPPPTRQFIASRCRKNVRSNNAVSNQTGAGSGIGSAVGIIIVSMFLLLLLRAQPCGERAAFSFGSGERRHLRNDLIELLEHRIDGLRVRSRNAQR